MFGRTKNQSTRAGEGHVSRTSDSPRSTKSHGLIQKLLRAFQFLSAVTSLIVFSIRLAKIVRLTRKASASNGAVEGIVAAAVLYTLITMALTCGLRAGGSNILRILFIVFDILFVGAFIAVAVLTSPKRNGSSAPCSTTRNANVNGFLSTQVPSAVNCNLPWGTFILAIVSTVLHALTAAFHVAKDHRRNKRNDHLAEKEVYREGGVDGHNNHNAPGYGAHSTSGIHSTRV